MDPASLSSDEGLRSTAPACLPSSAVLASVPGETWSGALCALSVRWRPRWPAFRRGLAGGY